MSNFGQSNFSETLVGSMLGSTEGTYYIDDSGNITDARTTATVSIGKSGLSFGQTQLDVANNDDAFELFESLLEEAVTNSRITQIQSDDFKIVLANHIWRV